MICHINVVNELILTLVCVCVGGDDVDTLPGFSQIVDKTPARSATVFHPLLYILFAAFLKISAQGHLRSGQRVRPSELTSKIFIIVPWLQFSRDHFETFRSC